MARPGVSLLFVGQAALLLAIFAFAPRASAEDCDAGALGMSATSADNAQAFTKVLSSCGGRVIRVPAGTYVFKPAGYANGFMIPAGTTLQGAGSVGEGATTFRVDGTGSYAALLWVRDVSNVVIRGMRLEGSPYDSGCSRGLDYGHAINVYSTKAGTAAIESIEISGNTFDDFNGPTWVSLNAGDGSPGIGLRSHIVISKNRFLSDKPLVGSCAQLPINYQLSMLSLHGSDLSSQGQVMNVSIGSNTFEGGYVKQGVVLWSGTSRIDVTNNEIRDIGLRIGEGKGELARYAINVYNSAHEKPGLHPSDIQIVGNTIDNPVSCGVYVAGGRRLEIMRNRISGQRDAFDQTLPKGAIALNHVEDTNVHENDLANNHIGITAVAGTVRLGDNHVAAAANGIRTKIWRSDHAPPQIER